MTRFITNKKGIYDNQEEKQYEFIAYDWIECDIEEVIELLNTLHQENKRKDIEIKSLNSQIKNWYNETEIAKLYENEQYKTETSEKIYGECKTERRQLEKENEQLKQSNDRFADTVAKQVSLLIELRKENEQLRQIMKDIVVATDETYAKNMSIFKVTVVLDFEEYNEIRRCI